MMLDTTRLKPMRRMFYNYIRGLGYRDTFDIPDDELPHVLHAWMMTKRKIKEFEMLSETQNKDEQNVFWEVVHSHGYRYIKDIPYDELDEIVAELIARNKKLRAMKEQH